MLPVSIPSILALALALAITSTAQEAEEVQVDYGQCGGEGWEGPFICSEASQCHEIDEFYYECLPLDAEVTVIDSPVIIGNPTKDPVIRGPNRRG
ncbi:uncharacterized protein DNG_09594 [Cephalotrichum gorgonifer]|uniref:CBM1 domain-containing protein n=1 Tax=Cephalotrichum gorgonifer TaxID=2041049 RepID=A0AAE8SZH7_9PEZI|nr:uncharacterized protein DNG_09594 [Cephalotrichum gorgonifer]